MDAERVGSASMRYDFYSLELFLAVATTGSIAGAASRMNTVPSAVSKRISDLERAIGTPLLQRHRRGVDLTPAGQELRRHAEAMHLAVERMEVDMGNYAQGVRGTIRIAANTSSITQFLPEDLALFTAEHPDLRIQLIERSSSDVLEAVRTGLVEIGIFSGFTEASGLQTQLYRRDTLVVAAPDDHRLAGLASVAFRDVLNEDFVALQQGSSIQTFLERQAAEAGARIRTRVQVMSFDGVRRMVEARLGIAILPLGAVEPYLSEGRLAMVSIAEDWAHRDLRIALREDGQLSAPARALLRSLLP